MTTTTLHLLDPREITAHDGVRLAVGAAAKSPLNPLFAEDQPWEGTIDNVYPNVVRDPADGLFKCWYNIFVPGETLGVQMLGYAVSDDGLTWRKPSLGLVNYRGSKNNNLVLPLLTGSGVALDEHAASPRERYKITYLVHPTLYEKQDVAEYRAMLGHELDVRGVAVGFSDDGLHWTLPKENPVLRGVAADTHNNWVFDPRTNQYVLITRRNRPWADGKMRRQRTFRDGQEVVIDTGSERVVKRWESPDFLHWSNGKDVFEAEGDEIGLRQFYSMPTFRHGNGWLGLLSLFNSHPDHDTVDVELAWSPDTIQWQRIDRGTPLIPRGHVGSYDASCIYAGFKPVVVVDEVRLYYGGSVNTHGSGPRKQGSLNLASLPRDRFAGWRADSRGELTTRAVDVTGSRMLINVEIAPGGAVQADLLNDAGQVVAGGSATTTQSSIAWPAFSSLSRDRLRVRLRLDHATVYTVTFE